MRGFPLYLIFTLTLIVTPSLGTIILARSPDTDIDNDAVMAKLEGLHEKVSELPDQAFQKPASADGRRNALENKVEAVIHQIEAGAFGGALNKLQNDVKSAIIAWINPDYAKDLVQQVDEIINLIKGIEPSPAPDFSVMASPSSLTLAQNGSTESTITVQSLNSFTHTVNLSVTSTSSSVAAKLNQSKVTPPSNSVVNATLKIAADSTAEIGDYTLVVTGTSGILTHAANISLHVTKMQPVSDFSVAVYPNDLTIQQGGSNVSIITVTSIGEFNQPVDLNITSPHTAGIDTTINPAKVIPPPSNHALSILTIDVALTAPIGSYTIKVSGTNGTLTHGRNIFLDIVAPPTPAVPDFSIIVVPPSLTVQQGSFNASATVVASMKGFSGSVDLRVTSQQPILGVTMMLSRSQVSLLPYGFAVVTMSVEANISALPGDYSLIVSGTSDILEYSVNIPLEIVAEKASPVIHDVLRLPEEPSYGDTVTVLAFVTDLGSGVSEVFLSYSVGAASTNLTMILEGGLYRASIPAFPYPTVVEYLVYASDKADNRATSSPPSSYIVADPYPPLIDVPFWSPMEPEANQDITINVSLTEPSGASGVQEVALWFKNMTLVDWIVVPMTLSKGNWAITLGNQSDTLVDFKIVAMDKAGNMAETSIYRLLVKAPLAFPLSLILLVILALAILIGSIAFILWRRRLRRKSAEAMPTAKLAPPPPRPPTFARGLAEIGTPAKRYEMLSFIVHAHNEESTISQRIARAFERAAAHAGPSEIIVVDDGSVDNTYEVLWSSLRSLRTKWPNVPAKVVKLSSSLGKEEASRIGRDKAKGEIVETVNDETLSSFVGPSPLS